MQDDFGSSPFFLQGALGRLRDVHIQPMPGGHLQGIEAGLAPLFLVVKRLTHAYLLREGPLDPPTLLQELSDVTVKTRLTKARMVTYLLALNLYDVVFE